MIATMTAQPCSRNFKICCQKNLTTITTIMIIRIAAIAQMNGASCEKLIVMSKLL